jgi:hypothetical protein
MLYLCPTFCLQDMNMYLVFSASASRPAPIPVTDTAAVLFFIVNVVSIQDYMVLMADEQSRSMQHWQNDTNKGKTSTWRKTCPPQTPH